MSGKMTPEIWMLLSQFRFPKLRLVPRHMMYHIESKRAKIHDLAARNEPDPLIRAWRWSLRNNCLQRAAAYVNPANHEERSDEQLISTN